MSDSSTDYAGPPGWGIDWSAPMTWARFVACGTLVPLSIVLISVALALLLAEFLETDSFLAFSLHLLLCVFLCASLAIFVEKTYARGPKDTSPDKLGMIASDKDRRYFLCLVALVIVLAGATTYAALIWLGMGVTLFPVSSIASVQVALVPFGPIPFIRFIGRIDPDKLSEPTPADLHHAQVRGLKSLINMAAGNLYVWVFIIACTIIIGISRL